jgi:hypothetical protein
LLLLLLIASATLACVGPASLDDRRCECAPGYACCEALDVCVRPEERAALACDVPDADTPNDGPSPDAPADAGPQDSNDHTPDEMPTDVAPPVPDTAPPLPPPGADISPDCPDRSSGVHATYYNDTTWSDPVRVQIEPSFTHYWALGAPHTLIRGDIFAALLSAELTPEVTAEYTFQLDGDDGARMWIDDELVLDKFSDKARFPQQTTVTLEGGRPYLLLIESYETFGEAMVELYWSRPGVGWRAIPRCLLKPVPGTPRMCAFSGSECVPPATPACGAGDGLQARYYRDPERTQLVFESPGSPLKFSWVPPVDDTGPFHARYEGQLEVPFDETYTFYLLSDYRTQLYLGGQQIEAELVEDASPEAVVTLPLPAGKHPIRVDWHVGNYPKSAFIQLRWKSKSIPKGVIPECRFHRPSPSGESPQAGTPP